MPKINIYVTDSMLEWMREHEVKQSQVFQEAVLKIMDGTSEDGTNEVCRLVKVPVRSKQYKIAPGDRPLGPVYDDFGEVSHILVSRPAAS